MPMPPPYPEDEVECIEANDHRRVSTFLCDAGICNDGWLTDDGIRVLCVNEEEEAGVSCSLGEDMGFMGFLAE